MSAQYAFNVRELIGRVRQTCSGVGDGCIAVFDLVGQTIGGYTIEALLGSGGMGQVFRARQTQLDRVVAFKILHQQYAGDPTFQARFRQEARAAAALSHPNIIEIYDFGQHGGWYYLVMEMVGDGSVRTLLRERSQDGKTLPLWLGLDLVRQAADGLAYAHSLQMVHRDIKPDNLLLRKRPPVGDAEDTYVVKISDFGLAKLAEGGVHTLSGQTMGTPAYMSPEQCQSGTLDGRSDLYSLGVVLYEVATGSVPFNARSLSDAIYKHVYVEPPPPREVRPDLSPDLEEIILRCLRKDPDERFATCFELAASLERVIQSLQSLPFDSATSIPAGVSQTVRAETAEAESIRLKPELDVLTLTPGEPTPVRLTVESLSNRPQSVDLVLEGVPPSWVSAPSQLIDVAPWSRKTVELSVLVPRNSDYPAGEYSTTVRARRHDRPDISSDAVTTLVIAPIRDVRLNVSRPGSAMWRTARAGLLVQNLGNSAARVELRGRSTVPGVALSIDPPMLDLDPGRSGNGSMQVRSPALWGPRSARLPLTVDAVIDGEPVQSERVEFPQRSLFPVWAFSLALVLIVGIGGTVLAFNGGGSNGGGSGPTATSLPVGAAASPTPTQTVAVVAAAPTSTPTPTVAPTATPTLPSVVVSPEPTAVVPATPTSHLLFTTGRGQPPGILEIYSINPDGSDLKAITQNNQDDWEPAISADGKQIAFVSTRDGNNQIYIMNADGSDQRRLTNHAGSDEYPNWSPTDAKITFSRTVNNKTSLYVINADGSGLTELAPTPDGSNWGQSWSPDGQHIVFVSDRSGQQSIYSVKPDGSDVRRLTTVGNDEAPWWSHDGQHIAFMSDRNDNYDIYVMNADGSNQTRLTDTPEDEFDPVWSPDDQQIGFAANGEIVTIHSDGTHRRVLTSGANYDSWLLWSPDGKYLAFTSDNNGDREIYVVNADGSGMTRLTDNPTFDGNFTWVPLLP